MNPSIAYDPWLSKQMGRPCYQLRYTNTLTGDVCNALSKLLEAGAFVTAKVSTEDIQIVGQLESIGFRLVDTAVTLETEILGHAPLSAVTVREARTEDRLIVEELARSSFRFTRFHLDPCVDRKIASEIKAQWAGNFFRGERGDFMVIAEHAGEICGFCQLLLHDEKQTLTIDLIAVGQAHRGVGAATAMIFFTPPSCGPLKRRQVTTQVANIPSLRLYEKAGYRVARSHYVLHAQGRSL